MIVAKDNSGIGYINYPNSPGIGFVEDSHMTYTAAKNDKYTFKIEDYVGNEYKKTITISNIDKVMPKLSLKVLNGKKKVVITAKATDNIGINRIKLTNGKYVKKINCYLYGKEKRKIYILR